MNVVSSSLELTLNGARFVCRRTRWQRYELSSEERLHEREVEFVLRAWMRQGERHKLFQLLAFVDESAPSGLGMPSERLVETLARRLVGGFAGVALYRRVPRPSIPLAPPVVDLADMAEPLEEPEYWVELAVVDEQDRPMSRVTCEIELPGGRKVVRTTNTQGVVRVDGIRDAGTCQIRFPNHVVEAVA